MEPTILLRTFNTSDEARFLSFKGKHSNKQYYFSAIVIFLVTEFFQNLVKEKPSVKVSLQDVSKAVSVFLL
jgi:hypothetical protein